MENQPICKKLQYLIGVPLKYIDNYEAYDKGVLKEIRALCCLRSIIIANFTEINEKFRNYTQLSNIALTSQWVSNLEECDIFIQNASSLSRNVIELNQMIDARMEKVSLGFTRVPPEWVQEIFSMPNGNEIDGVRVAVRKYRQFKNFYPYQKYINWPFAETPDEKRNKNILANDEIFLELLAQVHRNNATDLFDFIGTSSEVVVLVDCENSDAQRLYNALYSATFRLDKVILVDDTHTNYMWDEFAKDFRAAGVVVQHDELPRLKEQKSLVDHIMVAKAMEEYYKNQRRTFILATSDSDIWALITSLPEAKILILAEREKTGDVLIDALTQHKIQRVFLEDVMEDTSELRDRIMHKRIAKYLSQHKQDEVSIRQLVCHAAQTLNLYLKPEVIQEYVRWTEEEILRIQADQTMNACEIAELRTHNEWYTGHTTEKPDKVVIKVYDRVGKFKESIICPSVYYPLSGKYEVFNYTNTHLIGDSEEDQRILTIFDKIPYKVGHCYVNADAMTKALCEAGYKAQTYVGWMLTQNEVVHHAWTVLWVHDRPSVLDLADYLTEMDKMIPPDEKMPIEQLREKMADATVKLMQRPHHERCAPVGIPTPFYYFVGSPSNEAEGRALFRKLVAQFPDHPCMARVNKNGGRIPSLDLIRMKMGQ